MTSYHWGCCCDDDEGGPQGGPPAGSNPPDPGGSDAYTPPEVGDSYYIRVWQEFVATDPAGVTYSHILESIDNTGYTVTGGILNNTVTDGTSSCTVSRTVSLAPPPPFGVVDGVTWSTEEVFIAEARQIGTDDNQTPTYGEWTLTDVGLTTSPVYPDGPIGIVRTKWWLVKAGT